MPGTRSDPYGWEQHVGPLNLPVQGAAWLEAEEFDATPAYYRENDWYANRR